MFNYKFSYLNRHGAGLGSLSSLCFDSFLSFRGFVHFLPAVKFTDIKLFIVAPYYL